MATSLLAISTWIYSKGTTLLVIQLVRPTLVVVQNVYRVVSLYMLCTKTHVNRAYTFFVQNYPARTTELRPDFLKNYGRDSGRPGRDFFKIEAKKNRSTNQNI